MPLSPCCAKPPPKKRGSCAEAHGELYLSTGNLAERGELGVERLRASCWGCGQVMTLREQDVPAGKTAANVEFLCGGCGALNVPQFSSSRKVARPTDFASVLKRVIGRILNFGVPGVILFIMYGGVKITLPALFGDWYGKTEAYFLIAIGLFFEFHILWNYAAAVLTSPGHPTAGVAFGYLAAARDRRFENFEMCRRCARPRPLGTHHCSTCGVCVHDMDHHCIYINNCVGFNNRRSFVLFLLYASLGCAYGLLLLFAASRQDLLETMHVIFPTGCIPHFYLRHLIDFSGRSETLEEVRSLGKLGSFNVMPNTTDLMEVVKQSSCVSSGGVWIFVGYTSLPGAAMLLTGMLLIAQIFYIAKGTTQMDYGTRRHCSQPWHANFWALLGPPVSWLWPSYGPFVAPTGTTGWRVPAQLLADVEERVVGEAALDEQTEVTESKFVEFAKHKGQ